jgi:hypothetical protein
MREEKERIFYFQPTFPLLGRGLKPTRVVVSLTRHSASLHPA